MTMASVESNEGFAAFIEGRSAFDAPYPAKSKALIEWCQGYGNAKRIWTLFRQLYPERSRLDMLSDLNAKVLERNLVMASRLSSLLERRERPDTEGK